MNIICLEDEAFYMLIEKVVERVMDKLPAHQPKWVSEEIAMSMLNVSSKTTLFHLRMEGKIEFTQPMKKVILYNPESINAYLEKHKRKTF
ncbi:MAG: DNA-binding protein [Niastella sp.]|nr:DNA-binding protein [Niastella sp.]